MTNFTDKLTQDYDTIGAKVKRGMLPLVARNPAIERAVSEYVLAQADYVHNEQESGKNPPINYRDSDAMDRFADLILYEELKWSHPDKMSIVEYPIMSERNEQSYFEKYSPNSDLQYGDRRYAGRRKTYFTDDSGAPQVRNSRVIDQSDPVIDAIGEYDALYEALDNAGLTNRQREAIDLVYFENMTQEDAAVAMGIQKPNVNSYLNVALRKLRDYLTK